LEPPRLLVTSNPTSLMAEPMPTSRFGELARGRGPMCQPCWRSRRRPLVVTLSPGEHRRAALGAPDHCDNPAFVCEQVRARGASPHTERARGVTQTMPRATTFRTRSCPITRAQFSRSSADRCPDEPGFSSRAGLIGPAATPPDRALARSAASTQHRISPRRRRSASRLRSTAINSPRSSRSRRAIAASSPSAASPSTSGSSRSNPPLVRKPGGVRNLFRQLLALGQHLDMPERGVRDRQACSRLLSRKRLLLGQTEPANQRRKGESGDHHRRHNHDVGDNNDVRPVREGMPRRGERKGKRGRDIPLQPSTVSSARVCGGSPPRASRTNTGMLNIHAISPQSARPGPPRIFERPAHRQATNHVRQLKADKQEQHRLEQGREIVRCVRALMTGEDVDFEGRFFDLRGAIRPVPRARAPCPTGLRSGLGSERRAQMARSRCGSCRAG